jgi:riboflavin kinase/FMN adenylyltransferase
MQIYDLAAIGAPVPCVTALGYFDGGHIGHRTLIGEAVREARASHLHSTVFSFPTLSTKAGEPLMTLASRLDFFERMGVDTVVLAPFEDVRALSAEAFVNDVLKKRLGTLHAVCGFNYRFGRGATGDGALLSRLLPQSTVLPPTLYEDKPVSTSRIRCALKAGAVEDAAAMLGAPYTVTGTVTHGKSVGRTLGFPTANQPLPEGRAAPRDGVYVTEAVTEDGRTFRAVTDVGLRPTVAGVGRRAESHLIDFSGDLYGRPLTVRYLARLRDEVAMPDLAALTAQIKKDTEEARKWKP